MITKLILWSILSYGLMNIMVFGSIFSGLRNNIELWGNSKLPLNELANFISGILSCPMCFSTWGGFFLGLFVYSPTNEIFEIPKYISWFFDGIYSSGIVWTINSVIEWFEETKSK